VRDSVLEIYQEDIARTARSSGRISTDPLARLERGERCC
jgi:hypothetical protein